MPFLFVSLFVDFRWQPSRSAAQRRRGRRLRTAWRHEQQSIAQGLDTFTHADRRRPGPEKRYEFNYTATVRKTPSPQPVLFSLYDEEPGGRQLASLAERQGRKSGSSGTPWSKVADVAPVVQILDAPVPQSGNQPVDVFKHFDISVPEQVSVLYEEEPGGERPASLAEPPGPQERVQRHTVEHIVDLVRVAPMVQILDAPVPQMVDQLQDIMRFFDTLLLVPEQVVEVPKILLDDVPVLRDAQLVEQLVEVPTIVSYPWLQLRRMGLLKGFFRTFPQNKTSATSAASPESEGARLAVGHHHD